MNNKEENMLRREVCKLFGSLIGLVSIVNPLRASIPVKYNITTSEPQLNLLEEIHKLILHAGYSSPWTGPLLSVERSPVGIRFYVRIGLSSGRWINTESDKSMKDSITKAHSMIDRYEQ